MPDRSGPAFPRPYSEQQPGDRVEFCYAQEGVTVRQWYAGLALAGILTGNGDLPTPEEAGRWAVGYADALLAALEDKP